jgi:hypothetical protein
MPQDGNPFFPSLKRGVERRILKKFKITALVKWRADSYVGNFKTKLDLNKFKNSTFNLIA